MKGQLYLREVLLANGALERLFPRVPSSVEDQRGFVRELGIAMGALERLVLAVDVVVVEEVRPSLESRPADVTDVRPIVGVDQGVPLKELLVPESFVAYLALVSCLDVLHLFR